ncbi:hypothetical protein [Nocardia salmonicida]
MVELVAVVVVVTGVRCADRLTDALVRRMDRDARGQKQRKRRKSRR